MSKGAGNVSETCPMLARSDWGVGHIHQKGLTHALSFQQSPVGFHGPRVGGWLVFLNGCHRGEDLRLPVGETKIGSSWLSDLVLTGIGIGSQHATIKIGTNEAFVNPVSAERNIKINNSSISTETKLDDGCLISFGELHCIFRSADQKTPGYRPPDSPKPALMPNQASHREAVCGWFVFSKGQFTGQDYRLVNGRCRLGSDLGLEMTVLDPNLPAVALTLSVGLGDCKISEIAPGVKICVNESEASVNSPIRESDLLQINSLEGYIKWFRY